MPLGHYGHNSELKRLKVKQVFDEGDMLGQLQPEQAQKDDNVLGKYLIYN